MFDLHGPNCILAKMKMCAIIIIAIFSFIIATAIHNSISVLLRYEREKIKKFSNGPIGIICFSYLTLHQFCY